MFGGETLDVETSSVGVKQKWPIHRQPPPYEEVTAQNEMFETGIKVIDLLMPCLLYTSPSPRDGLLSRMPSSA